MSNDMDPRGHIDSGVAAIFTMLFGFGGVLSHSAQLQLPAREGVLARGGDLRFVNTMCCRDTCVIKCL